MIYSRVLQRNSYFFSIACRSTFDILIFNARERTHFACSTLHTVLIGSTMVLVAVFLRALVQQLEQHRRLQERRKVRNK